MFKCPKIKIKTFAKIGPTTKWISVNLINIDLLYVYNFSNKCILYINDIVIYFYFSAILRRM